MRADELLGALAQMRSAGVARMAQHPARVAGKPEFDLIDPACVQRREVQVKALAVPLVERMPDGLGAMRVQIVPDNVHLFVRVRGCHALHEGDQIVLGTPLAALCQYLSGMHIERGIVEQISRSHVQRILQAGDVRPHRVQQWLHSPDPAFREKVNVICKLYRKAPKNAVVLSIDEKTGIQAIERKHPGRAPAPGRLRRREFEYIRHGTQALIAALDVHTGQVLADCRERRTQDDLVAFMERVAAAYPDKQVHVIWDNLNTHRAHVVWQAFNARHDKRFHFHFTPLHASWVNQIELWFARYTRRVLRHASHTSTAHLRERTGQFIREHNQAACPYKWSFRGYPLQSGAS